MVYRQRRPSQRATDVVPASRSNSSGHAESCSTGGIVSSCIVVQPMTPISRSTVG